MAVNTYAESAQKRKLREAMMEMLRKQNDPQFMRYVMYREGYDLGAVDKEFETLQQFSPGGIQEQPKQKLVSGTRPLGDVSTRNIGEAKSALSLLDELSTTVDNPKHGDVFAPARGFARKFNPYDVEAQSIQAQINSAKQLIGKYLEGGVLRKEDEVKYEKILPRLGDSVKTAQAKIKNVRNMIKNKTQAELETLGQGGFDVAALSEGFDFEKTSQEVPRETSQDDQAREWLQANPDDPRADRVRAKLGETGKQVEPQAGPDLLAETEREKESLSKRVGEGLGSFFGGTRVGEMIGGVVGAQLAQHGQAGEQFKKSISTIEQAFHDGKIDEAKRDQMLEAQEKNAKDTFGYDGPSFKELAGDATYIALNFVPMAKAAKGASLGAKTLVAGKNVLKAGATGAAYATAQDKSLTKGAGTSMVAYAALTGAGKGVGLAWRSIKFLSKGAAGLLSGAGTDAIEEILKNPKLAKQGVRGNEGKILRQNTKEAVKKLSTYTKNMKKEYKKAIDKMPETKVDNQKIKGSILEKVKKVFQSRGVGETKKGLNFSKSRFIEPADKKRIELVWKEIQRSKDYSPKSLNVMRQRLSELRRSDTPDNKIINGAIDETLGIVRKELAGTGSEMTKINKTYADKIDLANSTAKILGNIKTSGRTTRIDMIKAGRAIGTLFTRNKDATRNLLKEIGGEELVARQAGSETRRIGEGQTSRIADALLMVVRMGGLPRGIGEATVKAGQMQKLVKKVVAGRKLDDIERRLLSRILAIYGQ